MNEEIFNKSMAAIDKTIELTEQSLVLKHKLKFGLWMDFHVFNHNIFPLKNLPKTELKKLFSEYCELYKKAFEKIPVYVTIHYPTNEQIGIWVNQMGMQFNKRKAEK